LILYQIPNEVPKCEVDIGSNEVRENNQNMRIILRICLIIVFRYTLSLGMNLL